MYHVICDMCASRSPAYRTAVYETLHVKAIPNDRCTSRFLTLPDSDYCLFRPSVRQSLSVGREQLGSRLARFSCDFIRLLYIFTTFLGYIQLLVKILQNKHSLH